MTKIETEDDLNAIEARAEAATEGPWEWLVHDHSMASLGVMPDPGLGDPFVMAVSPCKSCQSRVKDGQWKWGRCHTPSLDDAKFIAHARQDIPALTAALREARRERDEARAEIKAMNESWAEQEYRHGTN